MTLRLAGVQPIIFVLIVGQFTFVIGKAAIRDHPRRCEGANGNRPWLIVAINSVENSL